MELKMNQEISSLIPHEILFNYDEMKAELSQKLEKYRNMVVTDDNIKLAKDDKAKLNTLSKTLNSKRISDQKEYMKPFDLYKSKIDELIKMIDEPISAIDCQLKVFDDKRKEEKLSEIIAFYQEHIGNMADILPIEKILNPKWANVTVSILSVQQEMIDKMMTVRQDLKIIEAMKLDCEVQMKDAYLKNLSMSDALSEKNRFEEQRKRLEELKSKEQQKCDPNPIQEKEVETESVAKPISEELKTITATFYDTTAEFRREMAQLLKKYNIRCKGE